MSEIGPINPKAFSTIAALLGDFDYSPHGAAERTHEISGLIPDDAGPIMRFVSDPAPIARIRFGEFRPVTRRKRRLCERDGHPPTRLAPEFCGRVIRGVTEWVSIVPDDSLLRSQYCQRCGASLESIP